MSAGLGLICPPRRYVAGVGASSMRSWPPTSRSRTEPSPRQADSQDCLEAPAGSTLSPGRRHSSRNLRRASHITAGTSRVILRLHHTLLVVVVPRGRCCQHAAPLDYVHGSYLARGRKIRARVVLRREAKGAWPWSLADTHTPTLSIYNPDARSVNFA